MREEPRRQEKRTRSSLLWTIGSLAILALSVLLVWKGFSGIQSGLLSLFEPVEEEREEEDLPLLLVVTEDMQDVLLFFPRADGEQLGTEEACIFDLSSPIARGKLILERLANGPSSEDLVTALPPETLVREFWISAEGTAYVDFSRQIGRNHPGGTTAEIHTIYSIVNSLVYNLPEVRRVQLLIVGHEVDTLSGHVALWMPLTANYGLVPSARRTVIVSSRGIRP